MQKILMITEVPNKQAKSLRIKALYSIKKNPFSQFFGRLLFGSESLYRNHFSFDKIKWMHAKGSDCYGQKCNDGKKKILDEINNGSFRMVITFGRDAMRILFPHEKLGIFFDKKYKFPVEAKQHSFSVNRKINPQRPFLISCFPHASGRAQPMWVKHSDYLSQCLSNTQKTVRKILNIPDSGS